jgi:hypothetical protein
MTELPFEADERLAKIHQRAVAAGLPCVWYGGLGVRSPTLKMRLPDGQSGVLIDIDTDAADAFSKVPFEDITILNGYFAYWDRRRHEILATVYVRYGSRRDLWALPGIEAAEDKKEAAPADPGRFGDLDRIFAGSSLPPKHGILHIQNPNSDVKVNLYSPPINDPILGNNLSAITLNIEGVESANGEEAARLLFDISHAIFFELDANYSITLKLAEKEDIPTPYAMSVGDSQADPTHLPAYRLARDAVALYMYARTIRGYPLLEYLTFYQVIEHCMMAFSNSDVIERIRDRLEDPSFDINDSVGLSQFLASDRRGGRANQNEREQVKLTVQACVPGESIAGFLQSNREVAEFVSNGDRPMGARRVDLKEGPHRLPSQVADRIYDLRCRIVHAKGDTLDRSDRPLLPTSSEASQLQADLLLIRFVAQQVLRSASIPAAWSG